MLTRTGAIRNLFVFGFSFHLCLTLTNQAWAGPLVPFGRTGDLFVLDNGSGSVLRIKPDGTVSVELSEAQITAVTGEFFTDFEDMGIAFDGVVGGGMFFTDHASDAILKYSGGTLSVLTTEAEMQAATGTSDADPEGIAFGSGGSLFVNDDGAEAVLKVNPTTGAVSVHTSKAALEALGVTGVDLDSPIIGGPGGVIYTATDDNNPGAVNAIFEIASDGTPTILVADPGDNSVFNDLDVFMTRAPTGELIIADNSDADTIFQVTTAGAVSTFLSEAALEAVTLADVDLEGGIAFDSFGNFYVADEESDSILKFDTLLNGSIFVSEADITAVTGFDADLEGGIAFAAAPEPDSILLLSVCALGLVGYSCRRRRQAV